MWEILRRVGTPEHLAPRASRWPVSGCREPSPRHVGRGVPTNPGGRLGMIQYTCSQTGKIDTYLEKRIDKSVAAAEMPNKAGPVDGYETAFWAVVWHFF